MRLRVYLLAPVSAVLMFMPAAAQPVEVSKLEASKTPNSQIAPPLIAPNYITDVSGKKVRLVGPRFYPDSARALEFPGRGVQPPEPASEEALSQR
ncbi:MULTISPECIES: hypothetical protein [Agrobacterium]|uniref:Uncharacterized protein n=1 Tax=Agrobacterium tumefaciens TaxID=358 RepID=A0AAE6EH13_AGRTU|nr:MULTISPECIES: hypothetical protein [Agrobacterium]QCL75820.1 hypothetical protein CFBP5499_20330 [Agrobacterium tumefaciens]QCL81380.1 hypothetical protein CFBP5877_19855 [Agrobacterium tumefaciens]CUX54454.1 conserved exported hypothetical protein [Agrobacterium sp. NCPPB 925]